MRNMPKLRPAVVMGEIAFISLGSRGKDGVAMVNKEDANLDFYCWRKGKLGYPEAYTRGSAAERKKVFMHHMVVGKPTDGRVVDHINGDKRDNRHSNLRVCTQAENMRNCRRHSSKYPYRGVRPNGRYGWMAYLTYGGKQIYLGTHKSIDEAARAYNRGAQKYFGHFAVFNSITDKNF